MGIKIMHKFTNFSLQEFNLMWLDFKPYIETHWDFGSGRKCEVSPRDLLFMALTTLKNGGSWDNLGDTDHGMEDNGLLAAKCLNIWAVLADKRYQGIANDVRGISPHKNPTNGHLLKKTWDITSACWKWDRANYDVVFQCCVAFANINNKYNPIRNSGDCHDYYQYLNRLKGIADSIRLHKLQKQATYRKNRKRAIEMAFGFEDLQEEYDYEEDDNSMMD
ncbi:TPA: hypothetical protein N0F65_010504 [Lagenidium giganteum]|uniref:Uncharacterized protein n=1 Tax=Lagenidium giganteum TaxID=4803 RepID=A0AAV2Z9H7_9STRA|nr:TPA: hypothetical protein N0F65_010504 [Lagenidium giganteum]